MRTVSGASSRPEVRFSPLACAHARALHGSSRRTSAPVRWRHPARWQAPSRPAVQAISSTHGTGCPPQRSQAYLDSILRHLLLGLPHGIFPVVKNAGRQHRVSMTDCHPLYQMLEIANPPLAMIGMSNASENARVSSRSNPSRVPSRSMLVSRISPAPSCCTLRPHSSASRPVPRRPPPWVNTSQRGAVWRRSGHSFGVDGRHDALRAHLAARLGDQIGVQHRSGVDAYFVGTGVEQPRAHPQRSAPPPMVNGMRPAPRPPRSFPGSGRAPPSSAVISRKHSSSAPCSSYRRAISIRIAGIAQPDEIDALDHASARDVQTRNDSLCQTDNIK